MEPVPDFEELEPDDDSDLPPELPELPELPEEPLDEELSEPDFDPDSALAPDSDFEPELSELSPDLPLPLAEPPLTAPARLSVR